VLPRVHSAPGLGCHATEGVRDSALARDLVKSVRDSVTIDWNLRESVRAAFSRQRDGTCCLPGPGKERERCRRYSAPQGRGRRQCDTTPMETTISTWTHELYFVTTQRLATSDRTDLEPAEVEQRERYGWRRDELIDVIAARSNECNLAVRCA
jgi:hypothetical protein